MGEQAGRQVAGSGENVAERRRRGGQEAPALISRFRVRGRDRGGGRVTFPTAHFLVVGWRAGF